MPTTTPPVAFADDPKAPEFFVSAHSGFVNLFPNIGITFESIHVDHEKTPGPVTRQVVLRLALSIPAAQNLALELHNFLAAQGFDPTQAAKGNAVPQ
ncbi:MAG TPA: hypothetical protein VMT68_08600 [Caulobacteraceae bacterium]|nr:hypothetical protein [Caulobacteraceae bacterium]